MGRQGKGRSDTGEVPELVQIGFIRKPVGLKGWCGVSANGQTLSRLSTPCTLWLGTEPGNVREAVLVQLGAHPKGLRCLIEGYEDRDGAETLRGQSLYVDRNSLPSLENQQYYHFELEGLEVVSADSGEMLGTVMQVRNYPSVDALEIRSRDGREVLVPMTDDAVVEIDRDARKVRIAAQSIDDLFA